MCVLNEITGKIKQQTQLQELNQYKVSAASDLFSPFYSRLAATTKAHFVFFPIQFLSEIAKRMIWWASCCQQILGTRVFALKRLFRHCWRRGRRQAQSDLNSIPFLFNFYLVFFLLSFIYFIYLILLFFERGSLLRDSGPKPALSLYSI